MSFRLSLRNPLATREKITTTARQLLQFLGRLPQLGHSKNFVEQIRSHPLPLFWRPPIDDLF